MMIGNETCECCGGLAWKYWLTKEGDDYVRCTVCGLGRMAKIPSAKTLFDLYETFAKDYYLGEQKRKIDKSIDHTERLRELEPYKNSARLLDVGCSTGGFLHQAKAKGWTPYGVDISPTVCEVAREQSLDIFAGTIHEAKYPDNYFDVVRIWANLEHVPDPQACISESFRILRKGGLLLFSVPSVDSLMVRLLAERYCYICPEHLYYFSKKSIQKVVIGAGFKIHKLQSRGFDFFRFFEDRKGKPSAEINTSEATLAEQRFVRKSKKQWFFKFLKTSHTVFQSCLTRMGFGENWYVYACKPL